MVITDLAMARACSIWGAAAVLIVFMLHRLSKRMHGQRAGSR